MLIASEHGEWFWGQIIDKICPELVFRVRQTKILEDSNN